MSETKLTLTREDEADRDLRHTDFGRGSAMFLVAALLITIVAVPFIQAIWDVRKNLQTPLGKRKHIRPHVLDIGQILPTRADFAAVTLRSPASLLNLLPKKERIAAYEKTLEDTSWLTDVFLPPTQHLLTKYAGAGNTQVFPGRDSRWLVYNEDVLHLTGAPFLEDQWRSDAIFGELLNLNSDLEKRGITLVVVPTPAKPAVYPEKFTGRYTNKSTAATLPLQNDSYDLLVRTLRSRGVRVWEAGETIMNLKRQSGSEDLWLKQDTHWQPKTVYVVADALAAHLRQERLLPPTRSGTASQRRYVLGEYNGSVNGDLVRLLKLHERNKLAEPETITLQQVRDTETNRLLLPDPNAEILLIGDSYTDYYGNLSAGLMERLAFALQRPVDRRIFVDKDLSQLAQTFREEKQKTGVDALRGKKLVILQFTTRKFTYFPWSVQDLRGLGDEQNASSVPVPASSPETSPRGL